VPVLFCFRRGRRGAFATGGVLATVNPADKKIIHGMTDAILAPCAT